MDRRMTMVAAALGAAVVLLSGCGSEESDPTPATPAPSASASPSATTSAEPTTDPASDDLTGTWRDDAADWTVHLGSDGRFVVDFQGIADFLVGSWTREGDVVTLVGDDGNSQAGRVTDAGLVFDLGTLTRR